MIFTQNNKNYVFIKSEHQNPEKSKKRIRILSIYNLSAVYLKETKKWNIFFYFYPITK